MKKLTTPQKLITTYLWIFALANDSHLDAFMREGYQKPTSAIAQRKTSQNQKDVKASYGKVMTELVTTKQPYAATPSSLKNGSTPPTQNTVQSPQQPHPTHNLKLPQSQRSATTAQKSKSSQMGFDQQLVEAPLISMNGTSMVVKRQSEVPVRSTQSQSTQPHPAGTTLLRTPFNKKSEPFQTIEEPLTKAQVHQEAANLLSIYNLGGINKPQEILTSLHKDLTRLKKENPYSINERSILEKAIDTQTADIVTKYYQQNRAQYNNSSQGRLATTTAQTKAFFAKIGNQVKTFFSQTVPATFTTSRFSQQPEKTPLTTGTQNSTHIKPSGPTLTQRFSNLTQDAAYKARDFINNTETVLVRDAQGKTIKKERSYYDEDPYDSDYDVQNRYEETSYNYNPQGKLTKKTKTSFVTNPKHPDSFIAEQKIVTDLYNNGKESSVATFTPKLSKNGNMKVNAQGEAQFKKMPDTITQFKNGKKTSETELIDMSKQTMSIIDEQGNRTYYQKDPQYVQKNGIQVRTDYTTPHAEGSSITNVTIPSHLNNPQPVLNSFGQVIGFKEGQPTAVTKNSNPSTQTPEDTSPAQPAQPTPADQPHQPTPLYEPLVPVDRGYKKPVADWRV